MHLARFGLEAHALIVTYGLHLEMKMQRGVPLNMLFRKLFKLLNYVTRELLKEAEIISFVT